MRYYIDTEFLEDGKTIDLISIGVVSEDNRSFYAISSEFDQDRVKADPWMMANVWPSIEQDVAEGNVLSRSQIASGLLEFCDSKHHSRALYIEGALPSHSPLNAEFWGFNCAYDWVAVRQLYGRMVDGPRSLPNHCNDIKQYRNFLGARELPRIAPADKHNALADAYEVRGMFEFCRGLEYKEFGR
jgi:hypothetical protein